jgi:hypothetical protein
LLSSADETVIYECQLVINSDQGDHLLHDWGRPGKKKPEPMICISWSVHLRDFQVMFVLFACPLMISLMRPDGG